MAGPSVLVRVLGDASNLSKSLGASGDAAESAAGKGRAAFGNLLNMLNQTGVLGPFGDALAVAQGAMDDLAEHGKTVSDVMVGAGGALVAVGGLATALGSKEQAAHQQLASAIEATGHSYDEYGSQIEAAIKHNENFGQSSESTQTALQNLTEATHDPAKALQLLGVATDLAAAKHESLSQAATDVGKVENGNTKLLKEFGITIDKTTGQTKDHQTATEALANVLKGQAAASVDTFAGHLDVLKTKFEDQAAELGQKYGPALTAAGATLTALGSAMQIGKSVMDAFKTGEEAATAAQEAMTVAEDAGAVSAWAALGPILLIIAAIAALVAAAYVIYRNWGTIWSAIKAAVVDVWDWIKSNWPLLLTIIIGPVAAAAIEIVKHWSDIKAAAVDVWNWLKGAWQSVYSFVTAPIASAVGWVESAFNSAVNFVAGIPGRIGGALSSVWGVITGAFSAAWNWIQQQAANVGAWFAGIPGAIGSAVSGVWNALTAPFQNALSTVENIAGQIGSTISNAISSAENAINSIPGVGYIAKKIEGKATGGPILRDDLYYLHAGEYVVPNQPGAGTTVNNRNAPAVQIQTAVFSSAVDVDSFMKQAAWHVQTTGV